APTLTEEHGDEARLSMSVSEARVNMSTFSTFAVCMFGLMNQVPSVKVAAEMSRPTTMRRTMSNVIAGVVLTFIYLGMGIAVYLSFLTDTKPNFMQNYPSGDHLILACRIGLTVMLLVAGPMNLLPGLAGFYKALELGAGKGTVDDSPVRNPFFVFCRWIESAVGVESVLMQYGAPFFSITFCTLIALMVPNVASFIGSISSYLAAPLVCGFPGLVYAALQKKENSSRRLWPLLTIVFEFWDSKGPGVKRLFERWDYGHITTRRFLEELEIMGIGVPEEVVVLLTHNEKARGVHFTELAKILIRANRPCETPPSPAPSQVSSVSDASHRSRAGRREILRLGEESASAKAPFDNDYVAYDKSPKSFYSFRSDASSAGSRYSQRSYGYDALQRGRGVATALGAEDDDIAELADLEATLRSYGTSADATEVAPALRSHLTSGSAKLADGMELPAEPHKHP
ncbi:hypothetical protein FOL46_001925, partial [Perkinsus olseni]